MVSFDLTKIYVNVGPDGKPELPSLMLQGASRQSLPEEDLFPPWMNVMGDLFPASPQAADGAVAQVCSTKDQYLFFQGHGWSFRRL